MPELSPQLVTVIALISIATFVGTLVAVPWLLVRLPSDYFVQRRHRPSDFARTHPLVRVLLVALKNTIGWGLVLSGLAMLVLPGQGIITILLGVSLASFPGKHALERRLVRRKAVHGTINWIRRKGGRGPIELPVDGVGDRGGDGAEEDEPKS